MTRPLGKGEVESSILSCSTIISQENKAKTPSAPEGIRAGLRVNDSGTVAGNCHTDYIARHMRMLREPCFVYRHYDVDGRLLYVGIARRPKRRKYQHASTAAWGRCVATSRYTEFPTRDAALKAEADAIAFEQPIYNRNRPARPLGLDASKVPCPLLRDLFLRKEPIAARPPRPAPKQYAYQLPPMTLADLQDQWRLMAESDRHSPNRPR